MKCVTTTFKTNIFNNIKALSSSLLEGFARAFLFQPFSLPSTWKTLVPLLTMPSRLGVGFPSYWNNITPHLLQIHLTFADDLILFRKASPKGTQGIKQVISLFFQVSGQNINLGKSKLLLSNS